jgi:hypothetical protein
LPRQARLLVHGAEVNKLSPEDADKLFQYVQGWQQRLNLGDWRIVRSSKPPKKGVMAQVIGLDVAQRLASIRVGMDFGSTDVNDHSLEQTAVHELLHIMLRPLIDAAKDNETTTQAQLESLEHSVINTLERLLVPPGSR